MIYLQWRVYCVKMLLVCIMSHDLQAELQRQSYLINVRGCLPGWLTGQMIDVLTYIATALSFLMLNCKLDLHICKRDLRDTQLSTATALLTQPCEAAELSSFNAELQA